MTFRLAFVAAILSVVPYVARAADPEYDLVVRNGRVVDGSGNPWFYGDVAIRGDRLVAIGPGRNGAANRETGPVGLVVTPGFIDMHSHSDQLLLEDGLAQSKIRQGVTTEVLGEGRSAAPNRDRGSRGASWARLADYFAAL